MRAPVFHNMCSRAGENTFFNIECATNGSTTAGQPICIYIYIYIYIYILASLRLQIYVDGCLHAEVFLVGACNCMTYTCNSVAFGTLTVLDKSSPNVMKWTSKAAKRWPSLPISLCEPSSSERQQGKLVGGTQEAAFESLLSSSRHQGK